MKTETILNQLNLPTTKQNKAHAKQLIDIYNMLAKFVPDQIVSVNVYPCSMYLGSEIKLSSGWRNEFYLSIEGHPVPSESFEIKTRWGYYRQSIPLNTDIYRAFCIKFKNELPQPEQETEICSFELNRTQAGQLSKLAAIPKKDHQNEALKYVRLEAGNNKLKAVASDGIKVVFQVFETFGIESGVYYIKPEHIKGLKAGPVKIYPDKLQINSKLILQAQPVLNYPDYQAVWPIGYERGFSVFKTDFLQAIKQASKTADKVTKVLEFHVNGSIQVIGKDEYFNHETDLKINYLSKSYQEDFNFSMAYPHILEAVNAIESDILTIKHGSERRGFILNDCALVMPFCK